MLSLDAIVVPTRAVEIDSIKRNLTLWSAPDFRPSSGASIEKPTLHFVFNNDDAKHHENLIRRIFTDCAMDRYFSKLDISYLELRGIDDLYSRTSTGPVGPAGYKAGPNNQFFETMNLLQDTQGAIFYMETDCVPIRAGWIEALKKSLQHNQNAYIIGSSYRGAGKLDRNIFRHINGNAIYCLGQSGFQDFLIEWRNWLFKLISEGMQGLAYDVLIETVFSLSQKNKEAYKFYTDYINRLSYSNVVQNISMTQDLYLTNAHIVEEIRSKFDETYLVHGAIFSHAVEMLFSSGRPIHPNNLLVEPRPSPFFGGGRIGFLGFAKRWASEQLRLFANWLENNNIKSVILRKFFGS